MNKLTKIIVGFLFIILLLAGIYSVSTKQSNIQPSTLNHNGRLIPIEIADSKSELVKGLSGRNSLPKGTGLLFIFDTAGYHAIWMKDMKFPIDILWLDETFKVVDFETHISPETYPSSFKPGSPSRYVLELNAGETSNFNIKVGDNIMP